MANRIVFAVFLAVGLFLVINFSSRITAGQPLQDAFHRAQSEIEQLKEEQADLLEERDYVRSDAFVERWARDDGKMVRPGEVLVIPVPSRTTLAEPVDGPAALSAPVETTPPSAAPWTIWWALFFDTPPPDLN